MHGYYKTDLTVQPHYWLPQWLATKELQELKADFVSDNLSARAK